MTASERAHLDRIRDRFSSTAEPFAEFAFSLRAKEADGMAAVATANLPRADQALGLDLACGPGTLTRPFLEHLGRVVGVDLTPAMLQHARRNTTAAGPERAAFLCANAYALPFADGAVDIAFCGYAMHHLLAPAGALAEMTRAVRSGGRVAIIDLIVPASADREAHDRIERARDSSHASTLPAAELTRMFRDAGLHVVVSEQHDRDREFDHWMHVAGREPGSPAYAETRRLLEATIVSDAAGFRPRLDAPSGQLQFGQTAMLLVAEKE
jgi:ubiquinone/menaquinone biosynthesis C-methylase UbiE